LTHTEREAADEAAAATATASQEATRKEDEASAAVGKRNKAEEAAAAAVEATRKEEEEAAAMAAALVEVNKKEEREVRESSCLFFLNPGGVTSGWGECDTDMGWLLLVYALIEFVIFRNNRECDGSRFIQIHHKLDGSRVMFKPTNSTNVYTLVATPPPYS